MSEQKVEQAVIIIKSIENTKKFIHFCETEQIKNTILPSSWLIISSNSTFIFLKFDHALRKRDKFWKYTFEKLQISDYTLEKLQKWISQDPECGIPHKHFKNIHLLYSSKRFKKITDNFSQKKLIHFEKNQKPLLFNLESPCLFNVSKDLKDATNSSFSLQNFESVIEELNSLEENQEKLLHRIKELESENFRLINLLKEKEDEITLSKSELSLLRIHHQVHLQDGPEILAKQNKVEKDQLDFSSNISGSSLNHKQHEISFLQKEFIDI